MDNWRVLTDGDDDRRYIVQLTNSYRDEDDLFEHTFTVNETDLRARVVFDLADSSHNVQMDKIGLYEGTECGDPSKQPGMFPGIP